MKKWNILLMFLLTIVIIRRVEYISVPEGNYSSNGKQNYRQEVKITFEEGVMQIPQKNIINDFIPYGKVKMIKIDTSRYKFIKVKE